MSHSDGEATGHIRHKLAAHITTYLSQLQQDVDANLQKPYITYGTAGFRGRADQIKHLFYNVGLISVLRCLQLKQNVGIMVTASHNPIQDNGVKLVDGSGEMLDQKWEPIVENFSNLNDTSSMLAHLDELIRRFDIGVCQEDKLYVFIGQDTRPSSEALVELVRRGIEAWSCSTPIGVIDLGQITTPCLHYMVGESNRMIVGADNVSKMPAMNNLTPHTYYNQLASGLVDILDSLNSRQPDQTHKVNELVVDCANGVGVETMRRLIERQDFNKCLHVTLINTGDGVLNHLCGADYVKTYHLPPTFASASNQRYASLDGDADRVVYFYLSDAADNGIKLNLLDGDKIMTLYAIYLKDLLEKAKLDQKLSLGCVQTAYANGASTKFIGERLCLKIDCVDTGVKNLHRQALKYDFGIYFEANGHGTIWISDKAKKTIELSAKDNTNCQDLKRLLRVINNYTGDAISDILVVETILKHFDWTVETWYHLYHDMPNALIKVEIKDRNCIKTTNAGQTCTHPETLQETIDSIVTGYGPDARCFVRPSGTENVVRIYSEASNQESADELAKIVGDKVVECCN